MPPGVNIQGVPCWDNLDAWTQSKLIAYEQTKFHVENPPPPKQKRTPQPSKGRRRRR